MHDSFFILFVDINQNQNIISTKKRSGSVHNISQRSQQRFDIDNMSNKTRNKAQVSADGRPGGRTLNSSM